MSRAGYVGLIGRPNVGKSTLLNGLIEFKLSITSAKPQTTRRTLLGIRTLADAQLVYVDTPGLHRNQKRALNRYMNRAAADTLSYVDVVVLLVEALRWQDEDDAVLERLDDFTGPVIGAINKVDRVTEKARLLPFLSRLAERREFAHLIPVSALKGDNLQALEQAIIEQLPEGPLLFAEDEITTASERLLAAEIVREKLFRMLHDEVPYALTVAIEQYQELPGLVRIGATIWVERPGQKGIVIGESGRVLREVGRRARLDLERLLGKKVFLQTWVKVRADWSDDEKALTRFGYHES